MSDKDYEGLQEELNYQLNPPEFAPGQGGDSEASSGMSDEIDWNAFSGVEPEDTSSGGSAPTWGASTGTGWGGNPIPEEQSWGGSDPTGMGGFTVSDPSAQNMGMTQQHQGQGQDKTKDFEAVVFDAGKASIKGVFNFLGVFFKSIKSATHKDLRKAGKNTICVAAVSTFLFMALSFYNPREFPSMFFGSVVAGLIGLGMLITFLDKKGPSEQEEDLVDVEEVDAIFEGQEEVPEPIEVGEVKEEVPSFMRDLVSPEPSVPETKSASNEPNLTGMEEGIYTRDYLLDRFMGILPTNTPDFNNDQQLSQRDREFLDLYDSLKSASEAENIDELDIPVLLGAWKNSFRIRLNIKAKASIKIDKLAEAMEDVLRYNEMGQEISPDVQVTGVRSGNRAFMTIMYWEPVTVTLGDALGDSVTLGAFKDQSNKSPFIAGVDLEGNVKVLDFSKIYSMIIAGKPRTGKGWTITAQLVTLATLNSPKKLHLHIGDPKDQISSYTAIKSLPHVKSFSNSNKTTLDMLNWFRYVEGPRRKKLIGEAGVQKYEDYNMLVGEGEEIPTSLIVLDELSSFAASMTPDDKRDLFNLMNIVITQFPALGIKVAFIPHRIVNETIPKQVYQNVSYTSVVRQDFNEFKDGLEVTRRDFPYNLVNLGDMAVRNPDINRNKTTYLRSVVVGKSDDDIRLVSEGVAKIWNRLEPSEEPNFKPIEYGSVSEEELLQKVTEEELLQKVTEGPAWGTEGVLVEAAESGTEWEAEEPGEGTDSGDEELDLFGDAEDAAGTESLPEPDKVSDSSPTEPGPSPTEPDPSPKMSMWNRLKNK